MRYGGTAIILQFVCIGCAVLCVSAEWLKLLWIRASAKMAASTAFVVLAAVNGALGSDYGRMILLALLFSWVGDALLLSRRHRPLLTGIAAFFFAHLAFAAAFISQRIDIIWFAAALAIFAAAGAAILRWLWPNLKPFYKSAVPLYLAATTIMTALAVAVSAASDSSTLMVAAIAFAASDVAVASDRFVAPGIINRVWGLPLYYTAQLLFAMSVLPHGQ